MIELHKRLEFIDAMRGFTMLIVVYSHVLGLGLGIDHIHETFNNWFIRFRMPLFFFISGYFMYNENFDSTLFLKRLKNRFFKQLWPTVLIAALFFLLFYEGSIQMFLLDDAKAGYWFTLVSVEMFVVVASILYMLNITRLYNPKIKTLVLCCFASSEILVILTISKLMGQSVLDNSVCHYLSIGKMYWYLPFFILGVVARINESRIIPILNSTIFFAGCLILFISVRLVVHKEMAYFFIEGMTGIAICYYIFSRIFQIGWVSHSIISRALQYIGCNTLDIYLFHYWFIFVLGYVGIWKVLSPILAGKSWECIVIFLFALGITGLCLLLAKLLKRINIYKFIFCKE